MSRTASRLPFLAAMCRGGVAVAVGQGHVRTEFQKWSHDAGVAKDRGEVSWSASAGVLGIARSSSIEQQRNDFGTIVVNGDVQRSLAVLVGMIEDGRQAGRVLDSDAEFVEVASGRKGVEVRGLGLKRKKQPQGGSQ